MRDAIDDRTLLVSAMLAQNETGVLLPIAEVAELAHARGALLHVDAVQAAGKIPLAHDGIDFMTISGHKFHAPKGVGALTVRRGLRLAPLWYGGGQELGLRSGTEPVPSIVGLGVAAQMALDALPRMNTEVRALRDRFESALGLPVNGARQPRLPNTTSISFGPRTADIVNALDANGICVSAGAACHSGKIDPSDTMRAMGREAAVRFSLSRYTTEEEIDSTLAFWSAAAMPPL
jgi:cysteine desulfurase